MDGPDVKSPAYTEFAAWNSNRVPMVDERRQHGHGSTTVCHAIDTVTAVDQTSRASCTPTFDHHEHRRPNSATTLGLMISTTHTSDASDVRHIYGPLSMLRYSWPFRIGLLSSFDFWLHVARVFAFLFGAKLFESRPKLCDCNRPIVVQELHNYLGQSMDMRPC